MSIQNQSHARRNILTGEWVLVSPHRLQRPWRGQVDQGEREQLPGYDPGCYLCPGNERANGNRNPEYTGAFSFDNDYAALSPQSDVHGRDSGLFQAQPESGRCRVVCYTERHDLRLATMNDEQLDVAIGAMVTEFAGLDASPDIAYVQVFENRGEMMGCSNPHPHAQVWATSSVPNEPAKECRTQGRYFDEHGSVMLLDYIEAEVADGARVIVESEASVAVVPFWATWPFEALIVPRRTVNAPDALAAEELSDLGRALRAVLRAYESLFDASVPYSMGFHARPSDGLDHPEWQFHVHVYPPLLRSATVRKHMVGFEMLGQPQRDLTPEAAAERLRESL
jgi:UDPglucose--hexose-1-phosphate uridylyltransferase